MLTKKVIDHGQDMGLTCCMCVGKDSNDLFLHKYLAVGCHHWREPVAATYIARIYDTPGKREVILENGRYQGLLEESNRLKEQ